ncbi:MAG: hypothetical protein ABSC91_03990 [Candidatus Bathyarchaeia archaeon]|jgi:hypothetical protein
MKKEQRKTGNMGSYTLPYFFLKYDLIYLDFLNRKLPKIIENIVVKQTKTLKRKAKKLDVKSRTTLENAWSELETATRRKGGSSKEFELDEKATKLLIQMMETKGFPFHTNEFIRDMSLVYLVTKFENFLGKVLKITLEKKPELLMTCQKTINFEEILKLGKYESVKDHMIKKEIDSIINQDIMAVEKLFEEKFNVDLPKYANWNEFKERFCRRNILVHTEGMPNTTYRSKTGYKGADVPLHVTSQYLKRSIEVFNQMSYEIAWALYVKFKE